MNRKNEKYKESLQKTSEPIMPSELPKTKIDLKGMMNYAKDKGKKVTQLSDSEKRMFIK